MARTTVAVHWAPPGASSINREQRLRAADLRERPSTARSLTDQSGPVASINWATARCPWFDSELDRCPANVLFLVLDEGENGVHHLGAADLAERVSRRSRTPPIAVGNDFSRY